MNSNLLSAIIFAPLAGAVINWFVGRRLRNERFGSLRPIPTVQLGRRALPSVYPPLALAQT